MIFKAEKALNIFFPPRCPLCDHLLKKKDGYVCAKCAQEEGFIKEPVCLKCGTRISSTEEEYCGACRILDRNFDRCFSPFAYQGRIRESILRFKFHDRPEYAGFYAAAIYSYGRRLLEEWKSEVIIPVPIHRLRERRRGYNQALLIAEELSGLTGIPVQNDLVRRLKKTRPQKDLSAEKRYDNLRGAFRMNDKTMIPKNVLIVDDIFTTGATLDTLARILKGTGVRSVFCCTAATGED